MFNTPLGDCGCPEDTVRYTNVLIKLYVRDGQLDSYKVAVSLTDLKEICLSTPIGVESNDNDVYLHGRDLMVKISRDDFIGFAKVAEVIIDDMGVVVDLPSIDQLDVVSKLPPLSHLKLVEIANKLSTTVLPYPEPGPVVPPVDPEPGPVVPPVDPEPEPDPEPGPVVPPVEPPVVPPVETEDPLDFQDAALLAYRTSV